MESEELLTQEQQPAEELETQQEENTDVSSEQSESPNQPQDNEEFKLLSTYARNAAQQNQVLQQQLYEMRQQLETIRPAPQQQGRQPIVTDDDFRESPAAAMEKLFESKLEEKLNRTISPLLEAQREQQRERVFAQSFESTLSALNPALVPYAGALAPEVRKFLGNVDPTPQALQAATLMVIGNYALQGGTPAPSPANMNNSARNQPVPASAPSSAPRTKASSPKLTEAQLRAFNRLGYKPGQEQDFLAMLNSDEVRF